MPYAKYEEKSAYMSTEFGEKLARSYFGDSFVESLPTISRGKRKGKIKGQITWTKCVSGGWISFGAIHDNDQTFSNGHIERASGSVVSAMYVDETGICRYISKKLMEKHPETNGWLLFKHEWMRSLERI